MSLIKSVERPLLLTLLATMLWAGSGSAAIASPKSYFVYVGTFTTAASKGIYGYRFSPATGDVVPLGLVAETANPSWMVASPNHRFLYTTNEHPGETEPGNTITAYAIDPNTGGLAFLNRVSSHGMGPCHLAIDRTGTIVVAANFGSGSIATFRIHRDGRLGEASGVVQDRGSSVDPVRQGGPHAHGTVMSRDNRFILAADLGADRIFAHRLNASTGAVEANDVPAAVLPPGRAPRHMALHPTGRYLYLVSDKGLTTFAYDAAHATLKELQTVSLPAGSSGQATYSEVQVNGAGTFVYDTNREDGSVGVFAVDAATGTLTNVQHVSTGGKTPRSFSLDPTGGYLFAANQGSGSVTIFRVDPATGMLTEARQSLKEVPEPTCVVFAPAN